MCGKAFALRGNLSVHMRLCTRTHHGRTAVDQTTTQSVIQSTDSERFVETTIVPMPSIVGPNDAHWMTLNQNFAFPSSTSEPSSEYTATHDFGKNL